MIAGLVSFIIPTQNGIETIIDTIESARAQTHQKTEIIVVDDNGSQSRERTETERILASYIQDGIIQYIPLDEHKNGSYARNQGYLHSSGEYITYLDDDDLLFPEKTERELSFLKSRQADMVACGGYFINRERVGYKERPEAGKNLLYDYLRERYFFNTSTLLIKRQVIEETGGFDDRFYRWQDRELCIRIMAKYKVALLPEPLIIKLGVSRNRVYDADRAASLRDFYIQTRKQDILEALGEKKTQRVIDFHNRENAISYLLDGKIKAARKYLSKCKHPGLSSSQCFFRMAYLWSRKRIKGKKRFSTEELRYLL